MSHATLPLHHGRPAARVSSPISLEAFYRMLQKHNWYYAWSDNSSVYRAGEAAIDRLAQLASDAGPVHQWLLDEVTKHHFSGKAWGTLRHPLPPPPTQLTFSDALNLRIELAKAELIQMMRNTFAFALPMTITLPGNVDAILQTVRFHGFYTGGVCPPFLISTQPKLSTAWEEGQQLFASLIQQAK